MLQRNPEVEASEHVKTMLEAQLEFRKAEFCRQLEKAENSKYIPKYHDVTYQKGDNVYIQSHEDKGAWSGP